MVRVRDDAGPLVTLSVEGSPVPEAPAGGADYAAATVWASIARAAARDTTVVLAFPNPTVRTPGSALQGIAGAGGLLTMLEIGAMNEPIWAMCSSGECPKW